LHRRGDRDDVQFRRHVTRQRKCVDRDSQRAGLIGGPFGVLPPSQNQGLRPMGRSRTIGCRRRSGRSGPRPLGNARTSEQEALDKGHSSRSRLPRAEIGKLLDSTDWGIWHLVILRNAVPVFRPVDGGRSDVCARAARPGPGRSNRDLAEKLPEMKTPSIGLAARFLRRANNSDLKLLIQASQRPLPPASGVIQGPAANPDSIREIGAKEARMIMETDEKLPSNGGKSSGSE
jgi:hypothetical protein